MTKLFEDMGFGDDILKSINEIGFKKPTPVQEKIIPHLLLSNDDLLASAQTGTGKTAAFSLPIIQMLEASFKGVQAIVLCPTRELCVQITKDIKNYSKYIKGINVVSVYGGASIEIQIRNLKRGAHIVVGTPGRVLDLIKRKRLDISKIKWVVLDESDEMLNMGFRDSLDAILEKTPKERQTLLFSATIPDEIHQIAKRYMKNIVKISVGKKNKAADNLKHHFYVVQSKDKYFALKRIVDAYPNVYGIVFCRTRLETRQLAAKLRGEGYNADALHGELSQPQREIIMSRFREKHLQILVATDVAARGLDVSNLTHIINYGLPDDSDTYIHRSGRTGRIDKSGISISIIHSKEINKIHYLERKIGDKLVRKNVPTGTEICEKQVLKLVDKLKTVEINEEEIGPFLPLIYKKMESLDRETIIKHFVSLEFNQFLAYYKNKPDLNIQTNRDNSNRKNKKSQGSFTFSRFFINIGRENGLNAGELLNIFNKNSSIRSLEVGKIEIFNQFSFFDIDSKHKDDFIKSFDKIKFNGKKVSIEVAREPKKNKRSAGWRN